ncbi:unnamed protein product [Triticum turgidum subsp. durum]|uniref:RRM domain-containing protein n=1 Tax=Triticum turgidum subsp. durum TaxID=4567 RepID=A0A9R0QA09_TRITD|nr:unnamed protein product [Triticum turgidum subsp. durum]
MAEPSKVIHIRNVGHEITEADLLQLLQPFGSVSKLVMLRGKNQALLQMQDIHSSVSALQYYSAVQPSVRGRHVYMQFSSHQELTTDQSSHSRNSDQESEPNRILLATVHHVLYPITVEILHQVFKAYGYVEKIVKFQKSAGFQALIQYQSRHEAVEALAALHTGRAATIAAAFGGTLPPGVTGTNERCTLIVSNLNTDKTNEDKLFNLFSLYGNIVRIKVLHNKPDLALVEMADGLQAELAVNYLKMIHVSALAQDVSEEALLAHLSEHGSIVGTKLFEVNGKRQALVLFESEEEATEALVSKHATPLEGSTIRISFSQMQSL